MSKDQKSEKLGIFPYIISGLAYIPLFGIPFGITAIIWGLVKKKIGGMRLVFIGSGGLIVTAALYGSLFYFGFVERGGIYDKLRVDLAQTNINQAVQSIEFYKLQNGHYPKSLEILEQSLPKDSIITLHDPIGTIGFNSKPRYFYYELIDQNHYYLLSVGADGHSFTDDDILPTVKSKNDIGLLIKK